MKEKPIPVTRKMVSLPLTMWQEIEDFQFAHRIKKDSVAIRRLLELGLEAVKQQEATKQVEQQGDEPPAPDEAETQTS
jgi:hypothetical protein